MTDAERSLEAARIARHAHVALPLAHLVVAAADEAGFSVKLFRSERRGKRLAAARKACMVAARDLTSAARRSRHYSYPEIGRAVNRHHSTVIVHVHAAREQGPEYPAHEATAAKAPAQ
jgi:chromosomal replication initiation ATPase DnaA